jgi:hypothetical protein
MCDMNGSNLISELKKALGGIERDSDLRELLGLSPASISKWKSSKELTARQVAGLVSKVKQAAERQLMRTAIRPIVEFYPIVGADSKQGKKWELFGTHDDNGATLKYESGLQEELKSHSGVYIFFDSRGRAIYVGKAKAQKLWQELKHAYNRDRKDHQSIRTVKHPARNQKYATSDELSRQIRKTKVELNELATYFSAYHVESNMINAVEALLVRTFANDLLNAKMENFPQ